MAKKEKTEEKVAYLFPGQGQGTVRVGMGKEVYQYSKRARKVVDAADRILGWSLSKLCWEGPEEELLRTVNAQLAAFVMGLAGFAVVGRVKEKDGDLIFSPKGKALVYLAGHSIGYLAALVAAGAITFRQGLWLVTVRAALMSSACSQIPGKMLVLMKPDNEIINTEKVEELCSNGAQIAIYNADNQIILSGPIEPVEKAGDAVQKQGLAARVLLLKTEGGFHSECMKPILESWWRVVAQIEFKDTDPRHIRLISNTQAQIITTASATKREVVEQLCSPVLWFQTVKALDKLGVTTTLEMCGEVLTNLAKKRRFRRIRKIFSVTAHVVGHLARRKKATGGVAK